MELYAYLDTSGDRRSQVMSTGALVSTPGQWETFKREWPVFLKRYGVESLHMTDFVSSRKSFEGPEWKGPENSARRKRFIDRAVACVKNHTRAGFTLTLAVSDFDAANAKYEVEETLGSPLVICGMGIISRLSFWASRKGVKPESVKYFIEDGDEDKGRFMAKASSYGFRVEPLAKSACCIFEACDMAAWKFRTGLKDAENKKGTFENLATSLKPMDPIMHDNQALDRMKLELKCIEKGVRRRTNQNMNNTE